MAMEGYINKKKLTKMAIQLTSNEAVKTSSDSGIN
jgi:hypothetical protein